MGISVAPVYSKRSSVEFRTQQIKPFKNMFDSIKNNLPDTSIFFDPTSMKIFQLDATDNFLVNVNLRGEHFEHFYCCPDVNNDEEIIEINLSAIHLNNVFKSVTTDDNAFAFIYERGSDQVMIKFTSDKKSEERTYLLNTQNSDEDIELGNIESENFTYALTMPCSDLQRICRDFKTSACSDIEISHDGKSITFSSKGPSIQVSIRREGKQTDIIPSDDCTYHDVFKFSTFNEFCKCQSGGDSKVVKILLKPGEPLILHYEIGTLGEMDVALAPKQEGTDGGYL